LVNPAQNLNFLIVDFFEPALIDAIRSLGGIVNYLPGATPKEIHALIETVDILIVKSRPRIDSSLLQAAINLKLIIRAGSGVDHIDIETLERRGVRLVTTPEGNRVAVAEHALGLLLVLLNHIVRANQQVKNFEWLRKENRGHEIKGKIIGIIGYGNCGSAFAKRLSGFEAHIIAYDRYKTGYSDRYVQESSLDELYEQCDIVSMHVPLTVETRYMVDTEFIQSFRKPFWFLNLARGEVVETEALVAALKSGKIRGAGLDVLEIEDFNHLPPIQRYYLETMFRMDNVVFTPHTGGLTFEAEKRINQLVLEAVRNFCNY